MIPVAIHVLQKCEVSRGGKEIPHDGEKGWIQTLLNQ